MEDKKDAIVETQLQEVEAGNKAGSITIGLLGNYADTDETRFFLTPEACGMLTSGGLTLVMEEGAAVDISFSDEAYAEYGVKIVSRSETLLSDIVLSYAPLRSDDIRKMRKGATLLCMMDSMLFEKEVIETLLDCQITLGCFDNMVSFNDNPIFADIIEEIDGRAAIMYAQDYLSFTGGGKGVLLAGVTGIGPCEVLIIGEGQNVCYAAKAAIAAGADVTLMNNDISALQVARQFCGEDLNTLAIHPRVLTNKVKTADVILLGTCTRPFEFPKSLSLAMKESAYIMNFEETHPSIAVPRTVAMALSNMLVNFFEDMLIKNGFNGMLATSPGVQCGIITYRGNLVDKLIGSFLGMPSVDVSVMLASTN